MFVKNLLMVQASSVADILMLVVACSLIVSGSNEMDSSIISTTAQNLPKKLSNNIDTVDSSNLIKSQIDLETYTNVTSILDEYFIDLKTHLTVTCVLELENYKNYLETHLIHQQNHQKNITENDSLTGLSSGILKLDTKLKQQEENYKILFDAKTLLDNKLSASLSENNELIKKYTKSLETLLTCENRVSSLDDHQDILEKNLTTLELKIKDIIHEKDHTKVKMQRIIDSLQLEISLKTQPFSNISLQLENKIDENENIIQESIALKKRQVNHYLGKCCPG